MLEQEDEPEVVIFFAQADVLSGLAESFAYDKILALVQKVKEIAADNSDQ